MKLVATMRIRVSQINELSELSNSFKEAVQFTVNKGIELGIRNRFKLHGFVYKDIRNQFGLSADFTIEVIGQASAILKGLKVKNIPIIKSAPLSFNRKLFTFTPTNIRLATLKPKSRIDIPIHIPEYYTKYLSWRYQTLQLIKDRKGRFFFNITFSKEIERHSSDGVTVEDAPTSCGNKFLGIDLGINNLAVTSDGRFYKSAEVKQTKRKYRFLRTKLQVKGTRASKRLLKQISGKEKRYMTWINHNISKQIVDSSKGRRIVMENLKGIRKINRGRRMNYWISNWSFFQLQNFIQYKAEMEGIVVDRVKPKYTSKLCHKCGLIGVRSSGCFSCKHCNLISYNADLNAARNLAHPKLVERQAAVNQPDLICIDVLTSS